MSAPDLKVLHRTGWLADTPADFRTAVLARCTVRSACPGEALYRVGDDAGGLYGVVQGQVDVHGASHADKPTLLLVVGPGFWTGEFATATGQPRVISLVARSSVQMVRLSRADFLRLAEADPLAWRHLALMAVRNTRRTVAVIEALRREGSTDRLAATLVYLAAELGCDPAVLRLSQDDLGTLARLSRGSVNAGLSRLEAAGLLRRDYGAITLHDVAALAAFADAD